MSLKLKELETAIRAARDSDFGDIPNSWVKALQNGWRIRRTSCRCGGRWAWLDDEDTMFGCVCHHDPVRQLKDLQSSS
jgi:hypothetical protein